MPSRVRTAVPILADRSLSPRVVAMPAQYLEQSGVVDYAYIWDQLAGFWPGGLWRPENTPLAEHLDHESMPDPFVLSSFTAAATQNLGLCVSTDAIRRGPAELMQAMLGLASATEGKTVLLLGAGEVKQTKPFGYQRSEGLARLEDVLVLSRMLLERDEPFDYQGKFWRYEQAWIGASRQYVPKIWAIGAGPTLIDLAVRHADGWLTCPPWAHSRVDEFADQVNRMKRALEDQGRDPETFDFGIMVVAMTHDDEEVIERSFDNPIVRWLAGCYGRLDQGWEREGIEPVFPKGWHYAMKFVPGEWTDERTAAVTDNVSRAMVEKSFFIGSPKQVASGVQDYLEAGATSVVFCDMLPVILPLSEAFAALERSIDVCRLLKS
jgi:phthiodiolone/phenolphthiodiolone dimycocerosates ketoreductase